MQVARSAARTCGASRSASEYTASDSMPISRHARAMRIAISPRLAIRTRLNIAIHAGDRRAGLLCASSHSIYPDTRGRDRRVHGGRERQPEYVAGVERVDDAVIPQSRGGVIRAA